MRVMATTTFLKRGNTYFLECAGGEHEGAQFPLVVDGHAIGPAALTPGRHRVAIPTTLNNNLGSNQRPGDFFGSTAVYVFDRMEQRDGVAVPIFRHEESVDQSPDGATT